ncbi:glycosyltransferase family 2 protein [Chamaesiphon sp. OTE_20_metabat_361]|uniref:glycosyltransferase family 2 protein n=1 Tax=Chamaesiphon sp. OTE_20_metabat_361 TaxID=2964689 RepID=UPI00286D0182|nr:glycosyltransferase family 2 protein [Chamaesiphon sp. OTE_20_metabat_361]
MKPFISVCIPTYNGQKYLKDTLDSVLLQTYKDFEILIVDDRSSDNTIDIAEEYAARDTRIEVIRNPQNLGLVGNWNRCIELANGEWIKFVFQDDMIAPNCLEKLFAATQLGKPIIYCRREFIFEPETDEEVKIAYLNHPSAQNPFGDTVNISAQQYSELALKEIGVNLVGEPTSIMLHRNVFYQFGLFNPHLITICDLEFCTRVAINTGISQVPEVLAQFRVHGTSMTSFCSKNRNYRAKILDELLLIHDFAFHVAYAPIRAVAQQYYPEIDLAHLFDQKTFSAWKMARKGEYSNEEFAFSPHIELEKVSKFYPLITRTINRNAIEFLKHDILQKMDLLVTSMKGRIKHFSPVVEYMKDRLKTSKKS